MKRNSQLRSQSGRDPQPGKQSLIENQPNAHVVNLASVIRFKESDIAQRWLVSVEFCPDCERAKKDFADDFESGKMKVADVGSDKGFDIITKLSLFETPVFIIELKDGRYLIDE